MGPTPYSDVNALIERLMTGLRDILGDKLVGLYLFGSLTTGAFEEGISDVDLVAALAADLDDDEFSRLERLHAAMVRDNPSWQERIEIAYIAIGKLRRITAADEIAVISPGEPFHRTQASPRWLFDLDSLRKRGLALVGPPPPALIAPIPRDDLARALQDLMREWRAWITQTEVNEGLGSQGYMVITMCRCLYTFRTGEFASKRQAVAWAAEELPGWSALIRDALTWRESAPAAVVDPNVTLPQTLHFVQFAIDKILGSKMPISAGPT